MIECEPPDVCAGLQTQALGKCSQSKIFVRIHSFSHRRKCGSHFSTLCRSCRINSIDQAWQQCFYPLRHLIDWENKL